MEIFDKDDVLVLMKTLNKEIALRLADLYEEEDKKKRFEACDMNYKPFNKTQFLKIAGVQE